MKSAAFEYTRATSLGEACELLSRHGDGAKLLAGGQSLVPMMAMNFSAAISLMSISEAGRTRRIAIIGTRLCPPASSFAPSPCRASNSHASPIEAARVYSNAADFTFRS